MMINMSISSICCRVLKFRNNIHNVRSMSLARPELRFSRPKNLSKSRQDEDEEYKKDEPIGAMGYFLLPMPFITFLLGTWQVQRRKEKLELIEDMKNRTSLPPRPLPKDLSLLEEMEYHPITVKGHYLYEKEFAIGPRSLIEDGEAASEKRKAGTGRGTLGCYVITPFKVEGRDLTILVNRGWVRHPPQYLKNTKPGHVPGIQEITGVVRLQEEKSPFTPKNIPSKGAWYSRDVKTMAEMVDADPIFIDLIKCPTVSGAPISGQTRITLRNEHLAYIFTWYSLSAITGWMWIRLYVKKLPLW